MQKLIVASDFDPAKYLEGKVKAIFPSKGTLTVNKGMTMVIYVQKESLKEVTISGLELDEKVIQDKLRHLGEEFVKYAIPKSSMLLTPDYLKIRAVGKGEFELEMVLAFNVVAQDKANFDLYADCLNKK